MCPVTDGQAVSAAVTNPAFIDAQIDDTAAGIIGFLNTAPASGGEIDNIQGEANGLDAFTGRTPNSGPATVPSYTNNQVGTAGDPLATRADALTQRFSGASGHHHNGVDGQAAKLPGNAASVTWIEDGAIPLSSIEFHNEVYAYQSALSQTLYCLVKVPANYYSDQLFLRLSFYSAGTSGNALIQSNATLIRCGVDTINSATNQRTSTNSAVTLSGATVNIPQIVSLDLSDSFGRINGVSISANDLIIICLTRGTDTATSDLKVPVNGAEVTFV